MPGYNKSSRKGRGTSFGKQSGAEKSFYKKKKTDRSSDSKPRKTWNTSSAPSGFRKSPGSRPEGSRPFNGPRKDSIRPSGNTRFSKPDSREDKPGFRKPTGPSKFTTGRRYDNKDESKPRTSRFGSSDSKPSKPWDNKREAPFARKKKSDFSSGYSKPGSKRSSEGTDKPWDKKPRTGPPSERSFSKRDDDKAPRFSRSPRSESGDDKAPHFSKPPRGEESGEKRTFKSAERKFDRADAKPKFSKAPRSEDAGAEKAPRERKSFIQSRVVRSGDFVKTLPGGGTSAPREEKQDSLTRLNKFVANAGVGSRRQADELIKMGLISVNGVAITELGTKVKHGDVVRYEDRVLKAENLVYVLLNKPKGFITTTEDPQERNTVMGLVAGACKERIYPVGRLDRNTTGLLLLTNDGDLADKLTHPSYKAKKVYKAELDKPITKNDLKSIAEGVVLEEGRAMVDDIAVLSDDNKSVGLEIHIGWNRVVRRIFETFGYEVVKLDRSVFAGLDKKDLGRGQWRFLKPEEVIRLKHFK